LTTIKNEIGSVCNNPTVRQSNSDGAGDLLGNMGPLAAVTLLSKLARAVTGGGSGSGPGVVGNPSIPALSANTMVLDRAVLESKFNEYVGDPPFGGADTPSGFDGNPGAAYPQVFFSPYDLKNVIFFVQSPLGTWDYETKVAGTVETRTGFFAYIPCQVELLDSNLQSVSVGTVDWQTGFTTIQFDFLPAGEYLFLTKPLPTYDLNQEDTYYIYPKNISINPQASGGGMTITMLSFN
jgi:hypothetical protein